MDIGDLCKPLGEIGESLQTIATQYTPDYLIWSVNNKLTALERRSMEKTMDGVEVARLIAGEIAEVGLFSHSLETCMRWMKKSILQTVGFWRRTMMKKMQLSTIAAWRLVMQSAWQLAFEDVESDGEMKKKTLVWKMCQYMGDPCTGIVQWGEDWRHINIWTEMESQMSLQTM